MSRNLINLLNKQNKILVAGLGVEAKSFIRFIEKNFPDNKIIIFDSKLKEIDKDYSNLDFFSGDDSLANIPRVDIILRSPGVSLEKLKNHLKLHTDTIVTSCTEIFLEKHRNKTIGVTGTKGKSTTSSLIFSLLKNAGYKSQLVGNIGIPCLDSYYDEVDYFVYELSSFQLDNLGISPSISVFLNIFEEHLDYHLSFENYLNAKAQIFKNQIDKDKLFIPKSILSYEYLFKNLNTQIKFFDDKDISYVENKYCPIEKINLKGQGNYQNILSVISLAESLEINDEVISRTLSEFNPLPHRLEIVSVINGVSYVNDSISTVPQATINAVQAFEGNISSLILGGVDRGVDFSEFGEYLAKSSINNFILFPITGEKIRNFIESNLTNGRLKDVKFYNVNNMHDAVSIAKSVSTINSVCLLSPASPSFNLFKNFEERGDEFKKEVLKK